MVSSDFLYQIHTTLIKIYDCGTNPPFALVSMLDKDSKSFLFDKFLIFAENEPVNFTTSNFCQNFQVNRLLLKRWTIFQRTQDLHYFKKRYFKKFILNYTSFS